MSMSGKSTKHTVSPIPIACIRLQATLPARTFQRGCTFFNTSSAPTNVCVRGLGQRGRASIEPCSGMRLRIGGPTLLMTPSSLPCKLSSPDVLAVEPSLWRRLLAPLVLGSRGLTTASGRHRSRRRDSWLRKVGYVSDRSGNRWRNTQYVNRAGTLTARN